MKELVRKIIRWLASTKKLTGPRRFVGEIISYAIESKQNVVTSYNYQEKADIFSLIKEIKKKKMKCYLMKMKLIKYI